MPEITETLDEVKDLYQKVLGQPAPEIEPSSYLAFPPGVDPFHHAVDEVRRLKQLSEQVVEAPEPIAWIPIADSLVKDDAYEIWLEIPGVERDKLKVFVTGAECVVRGERKPPEVMKELRPLTVERQWGTFERRFVLPVGCSPDHVTARYAEGVLHVRVVIDRAAMRKEMKVEVA